MGFEAIEKFRHQKDYDYKNNPNSPLLPGQRALFDGLNYYPYNSALDLTVTVDILDGQHIVYIHTTQNEIRNYTRYAQFTFNVANEQGILTLYHTTHGFFMPFVDANAGKETYPAGRYIEPMQIDTKTFHIDFNLAYNPLCAYNTQWNCPITPAENRLNIAIPAGEKLPTGDWLNR